MSLADELLGDLDSGSDRSRSPSPPPVASTSRSGPAEASSSSSGLMLPPTLPQKRSALEASLDSHVTVKKEEPDSDDDMEDLLATPQGGVRPTDELDKDEVERMQLGAVKDVKQVAKLLSGKRLEEIMKVSSLRARSSRDLSSSGRDD